MGFNLAFWNRSSKMRSTKDKFSPYSNNHTDVIRQKKLTFAPWEITMPKKSIEILFGCYISS